MSPLYTPQALNLSDEDGYSNVGRSIEALSQLPLANNDAQALKLYWEIDNNLLIQGSLYSGAVKSLQFLISSVFVSTEHARPYVLELIFQIMNGHIRGASEYENEEYRKWAAKNAAGIIYYLVHIMISGTEDEQSHAEDIIYLILMEYPEYIETVKNIRNFSIIGNHQEQAFSRLLNR